MNDENRLFADFGLEDLAEEEGNPIWGLAMSIFGFVVWTLLAWTTAEFFGLYASGFGIRFGENAGMFVAAVGIILIDVGYVAWVLLGVKKANSTGQLSVALGAGVILFLISLLSTLVYTTLNSSFSGALVDDATQKQLSVAGQIVITGALATNGIASFLWLVLSNTWKRSRHIASIRSLIYSKRHSIDAERAERVTKSTVRSIRDGMQQGVGQLGAAKSGEYLQRGHMSQPAMTHPDPGYPTPTPQPIMGSTQPQPAGESFGFTKRRRPSAKRSGAKRQPLPQSPATTQPEAAGHTLYGVYADGVSAHGPTSLEDANRRCKEWQDHENDIHVPGFGKLKIYTVRPMPAAATTNQPEAAKIKAATPQPEEEYREEAYQIYEDDVPMPREIYSAWQTADARAKRKAATSVEKNKSMPEFAVKKYTIRPTRVPYGTSR